MELLATVSCQVVYKQKINLFSYSGIYSNVLVCVVCVCVCVCMCRVCVCVCVLTPGHDEVAVELSNDEGLRKTPEVLLEQAGHIVRVDISLEFHTLATVKAFTELHERGEGMGGGAGW